MPREPLDKPEQLDERQPLDKREPLDKDKVVAAAASLADAEGLDAVTLTRIALDFGVRQPALYRHVEGYDDLIRSLGLLGRQVLADRLAEAAIGLSGEDAVAAVAHAWRQMVTDHPGIYAATDRYPCAGDAELEQAVERVVVILGQALIAFDLSEEERIHAARSLRSALHGFCHLESGDGHPHPQDNDDTFEHLIELLSAGIRHIEQS